MNSLERLRDEVRQFQALLQSRFTPLVCRASIRTVSGKIGVIMHVDLRRVDIKKNSESIEIEVYIEHFNNVHLYQNNMYDALVKEFVRRGIKSLK